MRSQNKGFDPLSSLFQQPDPALGTPLPEVEEDGVPRLSPEPAHVDLTDPRFITPPGLQAPPPAEPPEREPRRPPEPPPAAQVATDVKKEVSAEERAAIARAIGKAAAARAKAAAAQAPPAPPAPPAPRRTPKAAPAPERAAEGGGRSRIEDLAAKAAPRRGLSAAEAARRAAEAESERRAAGARPPTTAPAAAEAAVPTPAAPQAAAPQAAAPRAPEAEEPTLSDRVQAFIPRALPNVGAVYVANAILANQRPVLTALWKAHRAKFLRDGELERAVGAAAVLHALDTVDADSLVAAHVVTDASDYLVWLDFRSNSLVAAFADARAYFAG